MIGEGIAKDRNEASQIGNALFVMSPPYIEHVTGDSFFQDDFYFFRFCNVPKIQPRPGRAPPSNPTQPRDSHHRHHPRSVAPPQAMPDQPPPPKKFSELYSKRSKLGEGAFSVVIEAVKKTNNKSYAIKIVTKSKLSIEDEQALKDEIQVLNELKHENIIQLYDVFDERSYIYLVTELMSGGELFDRIVSKAFYNEKEARDLCKILFEAIAYCHSKKVAHRDLKPENLLLVGKDNDSQMKIADFGFAKKAPNEECLSTQCGTPGYVAPEILEGSKYGTKADMWSLGVIVYILLGGYPPFIEKTQKALFRKIRRGEYEFHDQYWKSVSVEAKTLIGQLLTVDPTKRITAKEALQNSWITGDDSTLANNDLGINLAEFKKFNAKRKFKGLVNAIILTNKMASLGDAFISDLDI
jgi:serine/threonine protein kinase